MLLSVLHSVASLEKLGKLRWCCWRLWRCCVKFLCISMVDALGAVQQAVASAGSAFPYAKCQILHSQACKAWHIKICTWPVAVCSQGGAQCFLAALRGHARQVSFLWRGSKPSFKPEDGFDLRVYNLT